MGKKKNSLQLFRFRSVAEFLEFVPESEHEIVERLRQIIFDCIPGCVEKLSYNVPYYYRQARICFIWPASVPWGSVKMNGVQLGFCNGNMLRDEINYFDKGNRKQVYWKVFSNVMEIDDDLIRSYLFEAVAVDEKANKRKLK
jgi:hypothetical protein